ncbi:MAG: 4Fe-4S dicluster domain-containing protein [Candidatus Izemoplasmatales bacterium]
MLKRLGYPSLEQVKSCFPQQDVLLKPKAIIECYEAIPCNPCETSCPVHAITIGQDINHRPQLDVDRCTGCGICIHSCPGLAICVVSLKQDQAIFKIPYEFLPLPHVSDVWHGVNRAGEVIAPVKILEVRSTPIQDHTHIVTVAIDQQYLYDFITIRSPHE